MPAPPRRVSDIFDAAAAVSGAERERLLAEACAGDADLRREVDSLLAYQSVADRAFDVPAPHRAGDLAGADGLLAGRRLGVYKIRSLLGAGGMGEVYRARDTQLTRDVAIKVLPDLFAADPERLARFRREAQVLASLNHPNIAQIHGIEESGGVRGLVMELARR